MEKDFTPYEQALALKELGFDEPCFGTWDRPDKLWIGHVLGIDYTPDDTILAPTFSQAFRFFREKYNQHHFIHYHSKPSYTFAVLNDIKMYWTLHENISFKTYEEAELECLVKLIEIAKTQNK